MGGHNRTTCRALQDAIVDVAAKRKDLAIAEEKKALLLSRFEKAVNAAKKKSKKPNSTSSAAQPLTGGESCMGSDSELGDYEYVPWEMMADPREVNPPTTSGLPTDF